MKFTVVLFAAARQLAGTAQIDLEFETQPTITELKSVLGRSCPPLESLISRSLVAVNQEYAMPDQIIPVNAEIALIPPVSGG